MFHHFGGLLEIAVKIGFRDIYLRAVLPSCNHLPIKALDLFLQRLAHHRASGAHECRHRFRFLHFQIIGSAVHVGAGSLEFVLSLLISGMEDEARCVDHSGLKLQVTTYRFTVFSKLALLIPTRS